MKFKMPIKQIVISGTHNGTFDVQVGCARMAYENPIDLLEAIGEYLEDPIGVEKQYNQFIAEMDVLAMEMGTAMDRPVTEQPDTSTVSGPSVTGAGSGLDPIHRRQD